MRGGLSLPKRRLSGTWEPETAMPTEKPQVEEPRGREYGCAVSGSDCPIVVKKRGNSRGAKGAGHPRPNQFRSTGNRRNRAVKTEGCNLHWVARAVCLETVKHGSVRGSRGETPRAYSAVQVEFAGENADFPASGNSATHWAIRSALEAVGSGRRV